ncbi:MAG: hypothetical protein AAF720_12995 [Pseudomonadota bacterium]
MFGNGLANIVAALIVAGAIVWTDFGDKGAAEAKVSDENFEEWYARAVGDIRNDIVVNCGCCGDENTGVRKAANAPF